MIINILGLSASQWGYDLAYNICRQKASPMLHKSSPYCEDNYINRFDYYCIGGYGDRHNWITGYFWGAEVLSKDFLKPVKDEFGVGHAA